jgi:hypothetical protein
MGHNKISDKRKIYSNTCLYKRFYTNNLIAKLKPLEEKRNQHNQDMEKAENNQTHGRNQPVRNKEYYEKKKQNQNLVL